MARCGALGRGKERTLRESERAGQHEAAAIGTLTHSRPVHSSASRTNRDDTLHTSGTRCTTR
jgi:hypothetical protein